MIMAVVGFGMMELLILLAGIPGLPANDLVSIVPPGDYFSSRGVTVNARELMVLAGKEPSTPKAQVQQLLAIRWLGENAAATKKTDGARELLEDIASGKKAQDGHGFARAHARRAVALLDGKTPPPLATMPASGLRGDVLKWFPADMTLAGGHEFRADRNSKEGALEPLMKHLWEAAPTDVRKQFYESLEKVGNVRIDRIAMAMRFDVNARPMFNVVRVTGAGDVKRLAAVLTDLDRIKFEQRKGPSGESILAGESTSNGFTFAFVGEGDFLFIVDEARRNVRKGEQPPERKPLEFLDEVLAARAGKKKSLADGPLGKLAEQAPATSRLLFVGDILEKMRTEITSEKGSPFRAFPERILAYTTKGDKMTLTAQGTFAKKEEAAPFRDALEGLRQMGLQGLNTAPVEVPKELVKQLKETLEGIKLEVEGATVKGRVSIDVDALNRTLELLFGRSKQLDR